MGKVAELAGVSPQTVSRVLGHPELVTEVTRLKVQAAIDQLNYIPNGAARNLASNSSRMVAVIIPTLASSAYSAHVNNVMALLDERGISVLIGNSEYSMQREEQLVQSLLERRPQGFIMTGLQHTQRASDLLRSSGVPVVETWDTDAAPIDLCVGFSNINAGADVGRLMVARGAKKIAFVGGNRDQDSRSDRRFRGLQSVVEAAGLAAPVRVELPMPMRTTDGITGLDQVLELEPMTDAILFSADNLALAALLECRRRGIDVPHQLAICGFGDYDLSALVTPSLTTVRIQPEVMGRRAAAMILASLEGQVQESTVTLEHQLIRRGSC
ncbi:LacI family DNA-binding transcriptional regulator [Devosia sp. UYZn731]|uniref:LacI family DNA-binding transcriptional regulator n=1 Tax=Devosia sp. UYZn731 TaxID=3156345 RepID=UPI003390BF1C